MPHAESRPVFSGVSHARPGRALRDALKVLQRAERNVVLWFGEIARRKLYRTLGYSSIQQYATVALGFTANRTYRFLRLAGELERLPRLRASVAKGEIGWTKAREVVKVASPTTERQWIRAARSSSRRELEQQVRAVKRQRVGDERQGELTPPPTAPVRDEGPAPVTLRFNALERARFEALVEKLKKARRVAPGATREEILLQAMEMMLAAGLPRGKTSGSPYHIIISQCKTCGRAEVPIEGNGKTLTRAELAAAQCDAVVTRSDGTRRAGWADAEEERVAQLREPASSGTNSAES